MILSDGEITEAINIGLVTFDPPLEEEYLSGALAASALDLRLGNELQLYRPIEEVVPTSLADGVVIDPTRPNTIQDLVSKWAEHRTIEEGDYFDLLPHQFVLGSTLETVSLPHESAIAARVEGKSTMARLGFQVHMTAPTIHCGFTGKIVLEMYNVGAYPIRLTPGMSVCQLIFERLGEPPRSVKVSQYQNQTGPSSVAEPTGSLGQS